MAEAEGESLESWLNKATNPSNRQEDWEYIIGFCDQINKELEGPQIAVRLLAHKIQSPQEWEAVQALTVLEACMKNCGRRLHNEVGKFRFLNELIKVVSPKVSRWQFRFSELLCSSPLPPYRFSPCEPASPGSGVPWVLYSEDAVLRVDAHTGTSLLTSRPQ
ncbi:hypothetical protein Celaphus_00001641 [Cervus elaphus hippelaphus]|uniref:VHS domain-containing protein n=1 Tax=Cervus elaphus hippelaphus TaxID=46360 RepID=A0A212D6N8_CEREH|nr:hypothetical protein Celaphus_00001641 [Cervus elaphus hippelaphus]